MLVGSTWAQQVRLLSPPSDCGGETLTDVVAGKQCCDECGWNYIACNAKVPGSSPGSLPELIAVFQARAPGTVQGAVATWCLRGDARANAL